MIYWIKNKGGTIICSFSIKNNKIVSSIGCEFVCESNRTNTGEIIRELQLTGRV
jgi:hypothetical protein